MRFSVLCLLVVASAPAHAGIVVQDDFLLPDFEVSYSGLQEGGNARMAFNMWSPNDRIEDVYGGMYTYSDQEVIVTFSIFGRRNASNDVSYFQNGEIERDATFLSRYLSVNDEEGYTSGAVELAPMSLQTGNVQYSEWGDGYFQVYLSFSGTSSAFALPSGEFMHFTAPISVPEPTSLALVIAGAACCCIVLRLRK